MAHTMPFGLTWEKYGFCSVAATYIAS
jgi:hypothetical protein